MNLNSFERRCVPPHLHDLAERARRTLDRFETSPDTELRLEFGGGASAFVVASIRAPDSRSPDRIVCTQKAAPFQLEQLKGNTNRRLGDLAREALVLLLTHEVDEWLRVDGEPVRRPHPDRGCRIKLHLADGRTQTLGEPERSERGGGC